MTHALLVDDDSELRTLVADYLQRYGMQVTALADAAALRRALPDPRFDVLLLDLMLPDENGLDLTTMSAATQSGDTLDTCGGHSAGILIRPLDHAQATCLFYRRRPSRPRPRT